MSELNISFIRVSELTGKIKIGTCMVSEWSLVSTNDILYEIKPTPKVRFIGRATELLNMVFKKNGAWYAFGKTPLDAKQQISAELFRIREEKKAEYDKADRLYNSVAAGR